MVTVAEPIDADTLRIRHEFLRRPDLQVSPDMVAELFGVPLRHAKAMLDALVFEHFLALSADGAYVRALAPMFVRG